MISQNLFSGENKTNISVHPLLKILSSMLGINYCRLLCLLLVTLKVISANSVDPDQTAPLGAV